MHVTIAVTASWSNMEIANDLVHPYPSLYPTTLLALRIKSFAVVFAFALLDIFASAKCPRGRRVGVAYFIAGIAASRLLRICWRVGAVALSTVGWVQMCSLVLCGVPIQS